MRVTKKLQSELMIAHVRLCHGDAAMIKQIVKKKYLKGILDIVIH